MKRRNMFLAALAAIAGCFKEKATGANAGEEVTTRIPTKLETSELLSHLSPIEMVIETSSFGKWAIVWEGWHRDGDGSGNGERSLVAHVVGWPVDEKADKVCKERGDLVYYSCHPGWVGTYAPGGNFDIRLRVGQLDTTIETDPNLLDDCRRDAVDRLRHRMETDFVNRTYPGPRNAE